MKARPRAVRGTMFLWFTLIAVPLTLLAGMLVTDFSSTVVAREEARALADAASVAGAWAYIPGTSQINCGNGAGQAKTIAAKFVTDHSSTATTEGTFNGMPSAKLVGAPTVSCTPTSVTTTISYEVPQSAFAVALARITSSPRPAGQQTVSRTAIVCVPGSAPTVGGSCTRPDNR